MQISNFFVHFLLILPLIFDKVASSARGRAILHRLNKPLLILANNRTIGRIHSPKPSMPVFNYGGTNFIGRENELGNGTADGGEEENNLHDSQRQMLTALPDLSDPCFRRYANSIIVNAQPYERRSSISLIHCKLQCLRSQLGIYSCRSVVYDNINQVCDLFAHVGDQSPARLLRFQTRDYFEPTAAIHCVPPPPAQSSTHSTDGNDQFGPAMGVQQTLVPPAAVPTLVSGPIVWPTPTTSTATTTIPPTTALTSTKLTTFGPEEEEEEETGTGLTLLKPSAEEDDEDENGEEEENEDLQQQRLGGARQLSSIGDGPQHIKGCLPGQVPRFLRTKDFELFGQDQHRMTGIQSEQRCLELCADQGNATFPMPIQCNSLEYTAAHEECVFSTETAVPVGNGQLRQRPGTDYLERICVDQKLANECRNNIYRRFPQMILVGFAETVIDSASLQQCLDNCLNSQQLYGFRCSSGMFYFEEPQLNCILNTEDRESQPDLFTTETSDLVDYFETGCPDGRMAMPKMEQQTKNGKDYEDETNEERGTRKRGFVEGDWTNFGLFYFITVAPVAEDFVQRTRRERLGWTQWTVCTARSQWTTFGIQARWRVCAGGRICGKEERQCIILVGKKASGNSSGRQNGQGRGLIALNGQKAQNEQQKELRREQRKIGVLATIGTTTNWRNDWAKRSGLALATTTTMATIGRKSSNKSEGNNRLGAPAMNGKGRERAQPRKCRPEEECCPLLGSCRIGIRFGHQHGKEATNWCKNPCG